MWSTAFVGSEMETEARHSTAGRGYDLQGQSRERRGCSFSNGLLPFDLPEALTCDALCGEGAKALLSQKPIKEESVLAASIQGRDGGCPLLTLYWHHPGPTFILELDHKRVKVALGDCPGQAQRVHGRIRHPQLSKAGRGPWADVITGS